MKADISYQCSQERPVKRHKGSIHVALGEPKDIESKVSLY